MNKNKKLISMDHIDQDTLKRLLYNVVPVIREFHSAANNGFSFHYFCCVNAERCIFGEQYKFIGPYEKILRWVQNHNNTEEKKIIIISDEKGIAKKTAAFMENSWNLMSTLAEDEYLLDFYDEDEEEEEEEDVLNTKVNFVTQPWVMEVDFSRLFKADKEETNKFSAYMFLNRARSALFYGIENPIERTKKLETIKCCNAKTKYIHVPTAFENELWVRDLVREQGYMVLKLTDEKEHFNSIAEMFDEYYQKVKNENVDESMKVFFTKEDLTSTKKHLISNNRREQLMARAQKDCGDWVMEEDILWYLANHRQIKVDEKSAFDRLKCMTGLKGVKEAAVELYAMEIEKLKNNKLKDYRKHMIFYGNPGTGKSTVAELFSKILAETGHNRATFVKASRSDIIGRYVGHTAPKVAELFDEARGGVLMVDEAGFFLDENAGDYVKEAIKEFVRYMEEYEDVTVIFAMYAHELERFLNLDEGISSRIGRRIRFEDYTEKELFEIAVKMCADRGYTLKPDMEKLISDYLIRRKGKERSNFGNAREVRKLVESCIIRHAVRNMDNETKGRNVISNEDVKEGIRRLESEKKEKRNVFGFDSEGSEDTKEKKTEVLTAVGY